MIIIRVILRTNFKDQYFHNFSLFPSKCTKNLSCHWIDIGYWCGMSRDFVCIVSLFVALGRLFIYFISFKLIWTYVASFEVWQYNWRFYFILEKQSLTSFGFRHLWCCLILLIFGNLFGTEYKCIQLFRIIMKSMFKPSHL